MESTQDPSSFRRDSWLNGRQVLGIAIGHLNGGSVDVGRHPSNAPDESRSCCRARDKRTAGNQAYFSKAAILPSKPRIH